MSASTDFFLLPSKNLPIKDESAKSVKDKLRETLNLFSKALSHEPPVSEINHLLGTLGSIEALSVTVLPAGAYDKYFRIKRIQAQESSLGLVLVMSVLRASKIALELSDEYTLFNLVKTKPLELWIQAHWIFFSLIQGLIICCLRFDSEMQAGRLNNAVIELETATVLMSTSSVALNLAGNYSQQIYQNNVRPSMPDRFSGFMALDHSFLIMVWKKMHNSFKLLPDFLQAQQQKFILSYRELMNAHKAVCEKFGGAEEGSLLTPHETALAELSRLEESRLPLINPANLVITECTLHNSSSADIGFKSYADLLMRVFDL